MIIIFAIVLIVYPGRLDLNTFLYKYCGGFNRNPGGLDAHKDNTFDITLPYAG